MSTTVTTPLDSSPMPASSPQSSPQPHPQLQSALLRLPGELRNKIYRYALLTPEPILNPTLGRTVRPQHKQIPDLGTALLRTCRLAYHEADARVLYSGNSFRFTRAAHVFFFLRRLSPAQKREIGAVTLDLREAGRMSVGGGAGAGDVVQAEWLHYLTCDSVAHSVGVWCSNLGTLGSDVPHLRHLRLELAGWQTRNGGMGGVGEAGKKTWACLRTLVGRLKGLESLTVSGQNVDMWRLVKCPKPWSLGLWFPGHGNWTLEEEEEEEGLMKLLWGAVREECSEKGERKVVRWEWNRARLMLQVAVCRDESAGTGMLDVRRRLPETGECGWEEYVESKRSIWIG
ncbi:hypothetical protein H2203_006394 [Taxawa tesnikishii (nom. ined.)]|nr:hypothetical protein H2203_006394 [Dothideales sp. JES 119]